MSSNRRNLVTVLSFGAGVAGLLLSFGCPGTTPTPQGGTLTLRLDESLDGGGDIKADAFTQAELLGDDGQVLTTASLAGADAQFDLTGVNAGDYFIRVNGLGDDLVPTRIADSSVDLTQSVGKKLRASLIGDANDPTFRVKTFSKGQAEHAVVKYSNGANATPEEYAYAIASFRSDPQALEIRVLGTGAELTSYSPAAGSPHPFATWSLGGTNHGKPENFPSDDSCSACHGTLDTKSAQYSGITVNNGWCLRCHFGKGGDPDGMVNPAQ
jgi:hypothetical protein